MRRNCLKGLRSTLKMTFACDFLNFVKCVFFDSDCPRGNKSV